MWCLKVKHICLHSTFQEQSNAKTPLTWTSKKIKVKINAQEPGAFKKMFHQQTWTINLEIWWRRLNKPGQLLHECPEVQSQIVSEGKSPIFLASDVPVLPIKFCGKQMHQIPRIRSQVTWYKAHESPNWMEVWVHGWTQRGLPRRLLFVFSVKPQVKVELKITTVSYRTSHIQFIIFVDVEKSSNSEPEWRLFRVRVSSTSTTTFCESLIKPHFKPNFLHAATSTLIHGASTLQLSISLLSTRFWSSSSHQVGYCSKVEAGVSCENCYLQPCKTLKRRTRISFWLSGSLFNVNKVVESTSFVHVLNVTYSKIVDGLVSFPTRFGIVGLFSRHLKASVFDELWKRLKEINFLTNRSFNFGHILNVIFSFCCLHNWRQLSPTHSVYSPQQLKTRTVVAPTSRTGLLPYTLRAIWRWKAVIFVHRLMRPGWTGGGCEEWVFRFSPYTI